MKVSEHWLRTFINTPLPIAELADQLTNAGIEVDNLEMEQGQGIMTLKVPPNRGDCLSMEGVARELSLLNDLPFTAISPVAPTARIKDIIPIHLETPDCSRYVGCIVKNIKNVPTPAWLKERIEMAGIRSVSVIVDILNYVMLELGQPLHAFDLKKIESEIVVRQAKKGEKLTLLNEQNLALDPEIMVIADKKKILAIAGVMGGLDSSVTDKTQDIFIESAYFDAIAIRLSGKNSGIKTDASHRFERGVDAYLQQRALERAVQLILEIAGGEAGPIIEQKKEDYPLPERDIFLRKKRIERILGIDLKSEEIINILRRAQMKVNIKSSADEEEGFSVRPPTFRQDLLGEIDLIEEIARIYGMHQIPSQTLAGPSAYFSMPEKEIARSQFKEVLNDRGYSEAITYSFIDPKLSELLFLLQETLALANPIASDMAVMRSSLWPGLLQAVQHNQRRQVFRTRFFEMGTCFLKDADTMTEKCIVAGVCTGNVTKEQWGEKNRPHDFYDIKNDVQSLLSLSIGVNAHFEKAEHPALLPGKSAKIIRNKKAIGWIGMLHPRILKSLDLEGPVSLFELDVTNIQEADIPVFCSLSKFPAIRRDIAILVDKSILATDLTACVLKCGKDILQDVLLFDVYQGKGIEPNKKSVALGLILQHPSRTLVEGEVNDLVQEVMLALSNQFKAVLRE